MKRSFIFYSTLILIFIGSSTFLVNSYLNGVYQLKKLNNEKEVYFEMVATEQFVCEDGSCNLLESKEN